jgi:crotonobetainyl-CoA:carnitine CoA-transferase CaiB-like acyl-CoA transferase
MTDHKRTGPLADLTIIDCTMAYAGRFGTLLLADLGANVIKVEPPAATTLGRFLRFRRILNARTNTRAPGSTMAWLSPG